MVLNIPAKTKSQILTIKDIITILQYKVNNQHPQYHTSVSIINNIKKPLKAFLCGHLDC